MEQNPYAAPSLDVDSQLASASKSDSMAWFAVGTRKLTLMSILTLGLYLVHWFERQYRFQKRTRGEDTWPLARGIFSVFFANDLFKRVDAAARGVGVNPPWAAGAMGTMFVVAAIAGRVLDKVGEKLDGPAGLVLGLLSLATVAGLVYPVVQVQGTVNQLLERQGGGYDKNESFTVWNWVLAAFGAIVICLALVALVIPTGD